MTKKTGPLLLLWEKTDLIFSAAKAYSMFTSCAQSPKGTACKEILNN